MADLVLERIADWESVGLIDAGMAARLREAETGRLQEQPPPDEQSDRSAPGGPSTIASVFGPGVTIGEMFAYLGGAFLLGAYEAFVVRTAGTSPDPDMVFAISWGVAAFVMALLGLAIMSGDARRGRAAGVLLALATFHVGAACGALGTSFGIGWPQLGVLAAGAATVAAIAFRLVHPSLLTQGALLTNLTILAGAALAWIELLVAPDQTTGDGFPIPLTTSEQVILVIGAAVWWLGLAVIVGVIGLREARDADDDPAAGRRAALSRLWAGLVAVVGLASAVTRSGYVGEGEWQRIVEPVVADVAMLVLAAILVERAFRRDASTFVYAAALALILALTDFNFTYLSTSTEAGLLIEGIILLLAGFAADRLRRRIDIARQTRGPEALGEPEPVAPAAPA